MEQVYGLNRGGKYDSIPFELVSVWMQAINAMEKYIMKLKQIAILAAACCLTFGLAGCGKDAQDTGSGSQPTGTPTLEEIYAANTLEAYEKAHIQPSFSVCLREGEDKEETNALLTLYWDEDLGFVSRFRQKSMIFDYYFNKDGVDYRAAIDEEEKVHLTVLANKTADEEPDRTHAEMLFDQYGFGGRNTKETIISCTDLGDTYRIITDISGFSFTDSSGHTYTYTTQEYDVEKKTLRIVDVFRTYQFQDKDGMKKNCTRSVCMTYGKAMQTLPDFLVDSCGKGEWDRTFTLSYPDETEQRIALPTSVLATVEAPAGYQVYTDNTFSEFYESDEKNDDGEYPNRKLYIAK